MIDFLRDWTPDLLMILLFIIGGLAEVVIAILVHGKEAKRWYIWGIIVAVLGLLLLIVRFI